MSPLGLDGFVVVPFGGVEDLGAGGEHGKSPSFPKWVETLPAFLIAIRTTVAGVRVANAVILATRTTKFLKFGN